MKVNSVFLVGFISVMILVLGCVIDLSGAGGSDPAASVLEVEFTGEVKSTGSSSSVEAILVDVSDNQAHHTTGLRSGMDADKGTCQVTATWTRCPDSDFVNYRLYRSLSPNISGDPSSAVYLGHFYSADDTVHIDNGVTWETVYYYSIVTENESGDNSWSNEPMIITPSGSDLVVIEPSDTTVWTHGEMGTTVIWEGGDPYSYIWIEIWKAGSYLDDYCYWTPNYGSYTREDSIPGYWGVGNDFQIKVIDDLYNEGWSEEFTISGEIPEGMEFVTIPQGSFEMGSPTSDPDSWDCERPVHTVTFNYSFEMMTTEVTQGMWLDVMGSNPSYFWGTDLPVEQVSWTDCQDFEDAMNVIDPEHTYRLPSESEWEYCCRAGTTTRFYWGDDLSFTLINDYAWWSGNSWGTTHAVAQKYPNTWDLYDMSGNVGEWCQDWYHIDYTGAPDDGSAWESPSGYERIVRGGNWNDPAAWCRSANRGWLSPDIISPNIGFRLVRIDR